MNKVKVSDSKFLKKYVKLSVEAIKQVYPNIPEDKLKKIVADKVYKDLMNPEATVENTYTQEKKVTTLLSVFDYILERKPIIGGNATLFKQHAESENPNIVMLEEFDTQRGVAKAEMFKYQGVNAELYRMFNFDQLNEKKKANSWYGGGAMPSSAFYNKECAACTTKTARSIISTCMTTFEAVLADTFTFVTMGEFYEWCRCVLSEDVKLDDWVIRKNVDEVFERLYPKIIIKEKNNEEFVMKYLETLSSEQLTRLYWKYNLLEFTKSHKQVQEMYDDIYGSIRSFDYMKGDSDLSVVPEEYLEKVKSSEKPAETWSGIVYHEKFYDPNRPPKTIKDKLKHLTDIYNTYIYTPYMFTDRMYKLKNFRRNCVTVIDTDSNILSIDPWIEYCFDELMLSDYKRSYMDNVFININVIAYVISDVIAKTLDLYGKFSNIDDEHRPIFKMKNEFFFSMLILANVKKRYLAKMMLREGNLIKKPTYDIKGYDFRKASTSEETSDFFMNLVKKYLLEADKIDVPLILSITKKFRGEVRQSLERGEVKYLPLGSCKDMSAYQDPAREQNVRGVIAWNMFYPDDAIQPPDKISVLKTTIFELKDAEKLKTTNPEIYEIIRDRIFGDKTGMFVKYVSSGEKVEGLSVIAIPQTEKIPDWLIPYIDYTTVVNAVLAPFKSITETFGIPSIEEGPTGRKSVGFTNIVKL